ncbi:MAG TPA: hypothetical protein VLA26_00230 [Gammaproteobacteria bacterium]|nr:hypothetical protein [Gammaproteobacteria bacterium]
MDADAFIIDIARWPEPELPLAGWYGQPMTQAQAETLDRQARECLRRRSVTGAPPLRCRLQWLIARFWRGQEVAGEVENLLAVADDPRTRALVLLIHGQLLAAVRRQGALERLDAGFALAADLLDPEAYFQVLKRHAALRDLAWHALPASPQELTTLLREAAVIRRLRGPGGPRPQGTEGSHLDTLD